ncbi:MAG TPA: flagellar biosynthesis anti-sigma factor FlgM [Verrucomicrobiae bacterium]|nr:flagellar biosynthesis anti-sigma factor FlgM [Verrucomicrobiae bacterium]
MSIRIQNDGLSGSAAAETSRTQDVVQIGSQSSNAASRSGGPADSVEISSLFNRISDASNSLESAQNKRVSYLAQLYQSGRYQVDSTAVSRALVSQALGSSGTEG